MKNSKRKANRLIETSFNLMELFTEIVKNSIVFWFYFIRGLGFLTILPAIESLIFVSQDILNNERIKTIKNFKNKYRNTNRKRFLSILTFFGLFYALIFFLTLVPKQYSGAFIYISKYITFIISMFVFLLVLTRPLLKTQFSKLNWSLLVHIFLLVREFWWTLMMIISLMVIVYLSFKNFIFLLFVFPGTSGLIVSFFTSKIIQNINYKYIEN